jgi:alpha-tubulin suppressor-like RCC1 family protein
LKVLPPLIAVLTIAYFVGATLPSPTRTSASSAVSVAAGGYQTCLLTTGGAVKCWGRNFSGEVGDGSSGNTRSQPTDVSGLSSGVSAITSSSSTSCALSGNGLFCWGWNQYGTVGDATTTDRHVPTPVYGMANGVQTVAGGNLHVCSVVSGSAKCWGDNSQGQIGDGTVANIRTTPVTVSGLSGGVLQVVAGFAHTCALTTGGGVKCVGENYDGQLGDGTNAGRTHIVDVSTLPSGASALAAGGFHTCAVTTSHGAKCWGGNWSGQIGDGTTDNRYSPVDVAGLDSNVSQIAPGFTHTCALLQTGGVKCWGSNDHGQLGDGTTVNRSTPVDVIGLGQGVTAVAAGFGFTCAVKDTGDVMCWGRNDFSQLGDGTTTDRPTPVYVLGFGSGPTPVPTSPALSHAVLIVNIDFLDNNSSSVDISLACTSGIIGPAETQSASEAAPTTFTIDGFVPGTICIATEPSPPPGYVKDESNCLNVPIPQTTQCTITNTPTSPPPGSPTLTLVGLSVPNGLTAKRCYDVVAFIRNDSDSVVDYTLSMTERASYFGFAHRVVSSPNDVRKDCQTGNKGSIGGTLIQQQAIQPHQVAQYRFSLAHNWDLVPPPNVVVDSAKLLLMLGDALPAGWAKAIVDITDLSLSINDAVDLVANGAHDFAPYAKYKYTLDTTGLVIGPRVQTSGTSDASVEAWKVGYLRGSIMASIESKLVCPFSVFIVAAPGCGLALGTAWALYNQAWDPNPDYQTLVSPSPLPTDTLDLLPEGPWRDYAGHLLLALSDQNAAGESVVRAAAAADASDDYWESAQLANALSHANAAQQEFDTAMSFANAAPQPSQSAGGNPYSQDFQALLMAFGVPTGQLADDVSYFSAPDAARGQNFSDFFVAAKAHNYAYDAMITALGGTPANFSLGDTNCDGRIDGLDTLNALQKAAGIQPPHAPCIENADLNGDGQVDAAEAILILKFSIGLLHALPTPSP